MSDNTPINARAIEFGAFNKEFIRLVKSLNRLGIDSMEAANIASNTLDSFLQYANNNKFAESNPILLAPADDHHGG